MMLRYSAASYLYEQSHRADMGIPWCGDIPTAWPQRVPIHLQSDLMPAVGHKGSKALSGVDAMTVQQEPGVGIGIAGIWEPKLLDVPLSHYISLFYF